MPTPIPTATKKKVPYPSISELMNGVEINAATPKITGKISIFLLKFFKLVTSFHL